MTLAFDGIWVPLITPFSHDGGVVDHAALARLTGHLAQQSVAGFMPCGSTGEAAMLDADEQEAVLATVLAAARGKPVIMGLSGTRASQVAQRAQALAQRHAVSGWLLTAPGYVKPTQAGIVQHFHTVADATDLPIVAYDIPGRTGVRIQPATLLALADHPRIRAVKDCSGDRDAAEQVLADGRLAWLGGNDDEMFDQLARGACGAIAASAHLATAGFAQLCRAMSRQSLVEARLLWRQLRPITQAAFGQPNPMVIKGALARQGWIENLLREPLHPADDATVQALLAAEAAALLSPR